MILEQKKKSKDTLPFNETVAAVLAERARGRDSSTDYVFYNGMVGRIDSRNLLRAFYSASKQAGIQKLRFHDLRHTFATRLVQAGADIYTVQRLGSWKTIHGHEICASLPGKPTFRGGSLGKAQKS